MILFFTNFPHPAARARLTKAKRAERQEYNQKCFLLIVFLSRLAAITPTAKQYHCNQD
jgi:hypothetical protein